MKKLIITLLVASSVFLNAQPVSIGLHMNGSLPVGTYSFGSTNESNYIGKFLGGAPGIGLGGGVDINYIWTKHIEFGFGVGFTSFFIPPNGGSYQGVNPNDEMSVTSKAMAIPVFVHVKYLFGEKNVAPYVTFGTGYLAVNQSKDVDEVNGEFVIDDFWRTTSGFSWNQNGFMIQPGIGIRNQLSKNTAVDFSILYNVAFNDLFENHDVKVTDNNGNEQQTEFAAWQAERTSYLEISCGLIFNLSK